MCIQYLHILITVHIPISIGYITRSRSLRDLDTEDQRPEAV